MDSLISVLVLVYAVGGDLHESEHAMSHAQCMMAQEVLGKAIADHTAPPVEMLNGTRVPLTGATCIPGCFADAMSDTWDLKTLAEDEG